MFKQGFANEVKELQIVIEPNLTEIKGLDVRIRSEMQKLKLSLDFVLEIKQSRACAAKIQVALNKALEAKRKQDENGNVAIWRFNVNSKANF